MNEYDDSEEQDLLREIKSFRHSVNQYEEILDPSTMGGINEGMRIARKTSYVTHLESLFSRIEMTLPEPSEYLSAKFVRNLSNFFTDQLWAPDQDVGVSVELPTREETFQRLEHFCGKRAIDENRQADETFVDKSPKDGSQNRWTTKLPEDVQKMVFSYLHGEDLTNARLINRDWNAAFNDPRLIVAKYPKFIHAVPIPLQYKIVSSIANDGFAKEISGKEVSLSKRLAESLRAEPNAFFTFRPAMQDALAGNPIIAEALGKSVIQNPASFFDFRPAMRDALANDPSVIEALGDEGHQKWLSEINQLPRRRKRALHMSKFVQAVPSAVPESQEFRMTIGEGMEPLKSAYYDKGSDSLDYIGTIQNLTAIFEKCRPAEYRSFLLDASTDRSIFVRTDLEFLDFRVRPQHLAVIMKNLANAHKHYQDIKDDLFKNPLLMTPEQRNTCNNVDHVNEDIKTCLKKNLDYHPSDNEQKTRLGLIEEGSLCVSAAYVTNTWTRDAKRALPRFFTL